MYLKKFHTKDKLVFLILALFVSLYLLIYYGSWAFEDLLTLNLNKIGISYVRYFLPIYILSLPFVVICFFELLNYIQNKKFKILLSLFLIFSFLCLTINVVYLAGNDNLVKAREYINIYSQTNKKVISLTESNSVIISERGDKIFFPQRKVVGKVDFKEMPSWAKLLKAKIPLYYYAYENEDYMKSVATALAKNKMQLTDKIQITDKEYLYKIKSIP